MTVRYTGMHWLKCDLHMHTPADARHWVAAKAFAGGCYEKRLDVVGITEHNFLSKDFIPHLQAAFDEIERKLSHKLTLFPKFEFEAAADWSVDQIESRTDKLVQQVTQRFKLQGGEA